jgi:hypothetical protein
MAACHFRRNRARRKGFRYDPSLDLVAPASTGPARWLRRVDDVLDHGCEPLCARCLACCRSARQAKRWGKKAAITEEPGAPRDRGRRRDGGDRPAVPSARFEELLCALLQWNKWYPICPPTVPEEVVHRRRADDASVRTFVFKPGAFGAPLCGVRA